MGLFGKKKDPPLPEQLPPMPEPPMPSISDTVPEDAPPLSSMPQASVHDQIPNDVELAPPDFSPGNLPSIDQADSEPMNDTIPPMVESRELPQLPEVPTVEAPQPGVPEDVPQPPAIFSEEGFYDTPNEIRHLVDKTNPDYVNKYSLHEAAEYQDEISIDRPSYKKEGPLFVDVESFKGMIAEIEEVKNNIKAASGIMNHLNDIKNSKDQELERWRLALEDMQKKVGYLDKMIFKEA